MSHRSILWLLAGLLAFAQAHAELAPPVHDALTSTALAQTRVIDVYLPKDADKDPAQRYETLYVLDGDWNTELVVQTVDFLQGRGLLPPIIVVGVPNHFDDGANSRDHDLTPSPQPHEARSGGAAQFMAFFKTELIPYVNKRYPSNGVNLVHGHSYGGLFLAYVIANDPSIFDGYLLLDPAMWWNDKEVAKALEAKLSSMPTRGKAVFIAGRSGPAFKGMGVDSLQAAFAKAPSDLPWKVVDYPAESHDSMKFKATYDALRFMYRGYVKPEDHVDVSPDAGIVVAGKPVTVGANTQMFDIHYTTDGSEPNRLSPTMDRTLAIADPAHTRLKSISTRGEYDRDITLHLQMGSVIKPERAAQPDEKTPIHYAYYDEKSWPALNGKPFSEGEIEKTDPTDPRERYAARFERHYVIPSDGYYVVVLRSSEDAKLTFAGREIGRTQAPKDPRHRALVLPLQAGIYTAKLDFLHTEKNAEFQVLIYGFDEKESSWTKEVK
ncbi:MAG TPA: alpha/beta hydrolase-fold protein [Rudaea sp.]|jgi:predicted alpha/beta superfamily hydrolase|nr:alpha/beta hydrolase-fold protein [Rudaea sp.]